jgi:NAD-dependent SIR2 family protein deacetylase
MVYSGFRFCRLAQVADKPIAAINLGRTRADDMLALKLEASAEQILPQVARLLDANRPAAPLDLIDHRGTM